MAAGVVRSGSRSRQPAAPRYGASGAAEPRNVGRVLYSRFTVESRIAEPHGRGNPKNSIDPFRTLLLT
jgi:hypothetical protein